MRALPPNLNFTGVTCRSAFVQDIYRRLDTLPLYLYYGLLVVVIPVFLVMYDLEAIQVLLLYSNTEYGHLLLKALNTVLN